MADDKEKKTGRPGKSPFGGDDEQRPLKKLGKLEGIEETESESESEYDPDAEDSIFDEAIKAYFEDNPDASDTELLISDLAGYLPEDWPGYSYYGDSDSVGSADADLGTDALPGDSEGGELTLIDALNEALADGTLSKQELQAIIDGAETEEELPSEDAAISGNPLAKLIGSLKY